MRTDREGGSTLMKHKKAILPLAFSAACVCLAFLLIRMSRGTDWFGQWYATHLYPILPNTLGRLLSLLPVSFAELGVYVLLLLIPGVLVFLAVTGLRQSTRARFGRRTAACVLSLLCLCSGLFLMLTLSCSINYGREPFASLAGLSMKESSHQELVRLCQLLIEDAAELSPQVARDEHGLFTLAGQDVKTQSIEAMKKLGQQYPELAGYYPKPKPILFSKGMSYLNLTGIFSAFTIEANYNQDVIDYVIPYTICHELAHLKGFIKEEEAGFISYLACKDADSPALAYSGTLNALKYALNALYADSTEEEYLAIYETIPEPVRLDYRANYLYWQQFQGKVTEIATAANDTYLKANAQVDGVKSYGRITDLLLAYYSETDAAAE